MTATETGGEEKKAVESQPLKDDGPQTVTAYVALPPDGGWGWVVVAASFLCNVVVDGVVFSFGVFLNPIADEFNVSKSKVTIAGALLSGFYLIAGPFVSAIANRYGFRFTGILGAVIASGSFAAASYATNIETMWLIYGFIGGIGFGMIYVPAVITTGFYFEKWRALATGISVTGSGIGTIIIGPISTLLIEHFTWRGAILIQAGIVLNCAVFASLYRPLKPIHMSVNNNQTEEEAERTEVPLLHRIKMARDQLMKTDSMFSMDNEVEIMAQEPFETSKKFLKANHNILYPRAIEALHSSTNSLSKSNQSLDEIRRKPKSEHRVKYDNNLTITVFSGNFEKHLHLPAYTLKRKCQSVEYDPLKDFQGEDENFNEHLHDDVFYIPKKPRENHHDRRRGSISVKYRRRADSAGSYKSIKSRRNTISKGPNTGVRPLYRDDIFFQASLHRLPQYHSHGSSLDYTMSVTRLPTKRDVEEEEEGCQLCPEAVRRTLATMLDPALLMSPSFMIFSLAGFFTMMGMFTPFLYIADRGKINGMDPAVIMFLASAIGITNTLGRIVCGTLTMVPQISSLMLNNVALTIGGIATMASGFSYSTTYQFCFAAIFGLSISFWASLRSIIAVELIGLEKLTNAFGFLLLFQGLAAAIGSPIAGAFMDMTGSYDASFYLSGALLLCSGVMCYPLPLIKKWEDKRALRKLHNLA
ncbi:unnamed protein product [Nezara viridula]|uniref:Uncharacterized protein n=1 Tax=Nezara viridula TaxID=85310 RepID=A0A9P0GWB1_NEZVI|nr:unnamed protein product [Nezara viridula]